QVTLKRQSAVATAYQLQVTNLVGQELISRQIPATGNLQEVLNLEGLAKGIYLLQLRSQEGTATRKLIVE
ncbi:MAG TPA: T9SS type A sorting domain-containing protein, partial [Adhaeribacter sp.]|nr:T9SS type A sorting domain-containing protein [Adhaeribacter sp.]